MLGDVLYRPELMFPQQSEAWHKSKSGGFVSRYDGKVLLVKRVKNSLVREMEISRFSSRLERVRQQYLCLFCIVDTA